MNRLILILVVIVSSTAHAGYVWETWEAGNFGVRDLYTDDAIKVSNGRGEQIRLFENSIGIIEGTDAVGINEIVTNNESLLYLSGGRINQITSFQIPRYSPPDNPVGPEHIFIDCFDWDYNTNTNILSGHWADSSEFNILVVQGASTTFPVIDNIKFVPEPTSLALLGIGGFLIRRRKK